MYAYMYKLHDYDYDGDQVPNRIHYIESRNQLIQTNRSFLASPVSCTKSPKLTLDFAVQQFLKQTKPSSYVNGYFWISPTIR